MKITQIQMIFAECKEKNVMVFNGAFEIECEKCYDIDCPKSIINKSMPFDILVSELV